MDQDATDRTSAYDLVFPFTTSLVYNDSTFRASPTTFSYGWDVTGAPPELRYGLFSTSPRRDDHGDLAHILEVLGLRNDGEQAALVAVATRFNQRPISSARGAGAGSCSG